MADLTRFNPFNDAMQTSKTDFNLARIAMSLELTSVQRELLRHILRRFDMLVWYSDGDDGKASPELELCTFLDGDYVAKVSLQTLLNGIIEPDNDIGNEEEIVALEKIRELIDAAITARKAAPPDPA